MLSVVSTPIGNLGDITLRAIEALTSCDAIVCEDTRVTGQLLILLKLPKKELISLHSYVDPTRVGHIVARMKAGQHLCLVTDAGTPGISDPGYAVISKARTEGVRVEAVPGAAAFLAALSVSGLPTNAFLYLGFLPMKKGRKTLIASFAEEERTIVFYESVHRVAHTLEELADALAHQPNRPVVIARELTKVHEEVWNVTVSQLKEAAAQIKTKGEFVIIIGPMPRGSQIKGAEENAQ
jgi:16S rRNA (cytidine1402-2'-O)-methyltransferase